MYSQIMNPAEDIIEKLFASGSCPTLNVSVASLLMPNLLLILQDPETSEEARERICDCNTVRPHLDAFSANVSDFNNSLALRAEDDYMNTRPALKVFFYCVYALIFIVGLSGNALVCYVVVRNKHMHTVTNLFITNLALSDILLCLFSVPITPLYLIFFKEWVFGATLCHLVPYVQGVSVYISAFTLMSIAIDRYFVIIYPFKPRMKISLCLLIVTFIWLSAALLTLPYAYFMVVLPHPLFGKYCPKPVLCDEVWPAESGRQAFGVSTSVLQFVIPFTIISFCYIRVCGKLSDRARFKPGEKSIRKDEAEKERTRRTNRMLISMVVIFGVSWLPLNIWNLVGDFYLPATNWPYSRPFFFLVHALAMSSTCYNPFLYAWLNDNFRKEFKQVLPCYSSAIRGGSKSNATISGHGLNRKSTGNDAVARSNNGGGSQRGKSIENADDRSSGRRNENSCNHLILNQVNDGKRISESDQTNCSSRGAIKLKLLKSASTHYDHDENRVIESETETNIQELEDNQSDRERLVAHDLAARNATSNFPS